ncbi:MAG: alginate export family protein [Pirellulales bacterium]|nr:alginate export family protein [Pirellulales bacterium]
MKRVTATCLIVLLVCSVPRARAQSPQAPGEDAEHLGQERHAQTDDFSPVQGDALLVSDATSAAPAKPGGASAPKKKDPPKFKGPFHGTPPLLGFPRLGFFPVFPTGPGYYSVEDWLSGTCRQQPPPFPYGRFSLKPFPFYDVDFRYLDDPNNTYFTWSDFLKRQQIGDSWLFSAGGEYRNRYMHETDSRLTTIQNTYEQMRTIAYGSLYYEDLFGCYVQFLDAQHFRSELAPLAIDRDRSDLTDLFVDVKLAEWDDHPLYVRGGRQELLLGSQRLVSNLEWGNVLRTFQGVRGFRQGERWDFNAFWLQPIIPDPSNFDSPDEDQNLSGAWLTYRQKPGRFWDFYALNRDDSRRIFSGENGVLGGQNVTTLGTRLAGDVESTWLYDVEEMLQVGRHSNQDLVAYASSSGVGYNFSELRMKPQCWLYYDFASGDANPGQGATFGTFNHLYPFGHYYLGYLDLVARQNIQDLNVQVVAFPTKFTYFLVQWHKFNLAQARSPLFGAAGGIERVDPTGAAGTDVGNEIDLLMNFHLTANQDILVGYSKLFAGDFIRSTGPNVSPELFYLQHSLRW